MAAHFGAPMLFDHFAERDDNGEFKPVSYQAPNENARQITAIVGRLVVNDQDGTEQATQTDEMRESVQLEVDGGESIVIGALVTIPKYAGEPFYVESVNVSGAMQTVQTARFTVRQKARRGFSRGRS